MNPPASNHIGPPAPPLPEATLLAISQALSGLHYGQINIIVQDGRIVQIDRTDRFRLSIAKRPTEI